MGIPDVMSKEQNMQTQEKLGGAAVSGDLDTFDEVFADDVVDHDPAPGQGSGPAGFKDFFATLRSAFPDMDIAVEHVVQDEDNVAIAYTLTGTQDGEFHGVAPTGSKVKVRGMQIARFEDGKIVERWGATDELGILHQIDAAPVS